jgi:tetratricopeptide (TPR) repeat protein
LLGRLIDTASLLLLEEKQIAEPLKVPQDWWELVFKVGEVFALLSPLCQRQKRRWILVLDGLDRLAEVDQQALPWIPTTIPPGIHVVASALDCPARTILQELQYCSHEIGPLGKAEQQQLIERYLSRYTKQLESGLQQRILAHRLAGSPLFLKVLLEELRQCAWFDTLGEQLEFYLSTESIDWLYAKVLERLERDGHAEATRRSLTALWASRAGLSETELLEITGLALLEWAPVDLALSEAFGRNGERLVFDHDYIRIAVQDRYLPLAQERCQAHRTLADWYCTPAKWDERKAEELPWQLMRAGRLKDLRSLLLRIEDLYQFATIRKKREVIDYWQAAKGDVHAELDELIADAVEREIKTQFDNPLGLILFVDCIAGLLDEAGLQRTLLLQCRALSLKLHEATEGLDETSILNSISSQAGAHLDIGNYNEAESLYLQCLKFRERLQGSEHPSTLTAVNNLGLLYINKGDYEQAEALYTRCIEAQERLLGPEHPETLTTICNLGALHIEKGGYEQAKALYTRCLEAEERLLGSEHPSTLKTLNNLGLLYSNKGDHEQAEAFYTRCIEAQERLLGPEHPDTLTTIGNLGALHSEKGNYAKAESYLQRCLAAQERLLGIEHRSTIIALGNLGGLYRDKGDFDRAEAVFMRCLDACEQLLGPEHPFTLTSIGNLGGLHGDKGDYEQAEVYYTRYLAECERLLGPEHRDTNGARVSLANLLSDQERYEEAIALRRQELGVAAKRDGRTAPGTLTSVYQLGQDLYWSGELEESEQFLREALDGHIECLGDANEATMACRYGLARSLVELGRDTEALPLLDHLLATLSALEHLDDQEQIIHKAACHLLDCITAEG